MPITTSKGRRPPEPRRFGFSTTTARGPSFRQLSYAPGMGYIDVVGTDSYQPFTGTNAEANKKLYGKYSYSAQSAIQRALNEPLIAEHLTSNTGTAPELVVLGDSLLKGLVLGRTLFFQNDTFKDPVFNPSGRIFAVDILKVPFADQWLEPVDGDFYHISKIEEILRDLERNKALEQFGHVLPISDRFCQSREQLQAYLNGHGAP